MDERKEARFSLPGYESPVRVSRLVILLLALSGGVALLSAASTGEQIGLLQRIESGESVPEEAAEASDERQRFVAAVQLVVLLGTVPAFLVWNVRVRRNLTTISARTPAFSPGWAIGAWFVPLLNLVRPFQIVAEIMWISSSPSQAALASPGFRPRVPFWLYLWWVLFLAAGITSRWAETSYNARSVAGLISASQMAILSDLVLAAAAVLAILVVRRISLSQESAARALSR